MGGQSFFPDMEPVRRMKALTICQPWAWAIAKGFKLVENRSWATNYRGPLAIHAGLSRKWIDGGRTHLWEAAQRFDRPAWTMPDEDALVYGAIVAVVDLVDCLKIDELRRRSAPNAAPEILGFAGGPWCWLLENVRALESPFPYKGAQGLFNFDLETQVEIFARCSPAPSP